MSCDRVSPCRARAHLGRDLGWQATYVGRDVREPFALVVELVERGGEVDDGRTATLLDELEVPVKVCRVELVVSVALLVHERFGALVWNVEGDDRVPVPEGGAGDTLSHQTVGAGDSYGEGHAGVVVEIEI